jgi:sulfoquinovose isomerase
LTGKSLNWIDSTSHWEWLSHQTDALLAFYGRNAADLENGGFWWVDNSGDPIRSQGKQLWINARLTYTFAIGTLLGRPGYGPLVQHGLDFLSDGPIRDEVNGGWYWVLDENGTPSDDSKQAYGHAFVLLAASAGLIAGFDSRKLLDDALSVLMERFWSDDEEMFVDTWNREFSELEPYRGQNANMHLVEALMSAAEVTGDDQLLAKATKIAERLIREVTANNQWRLPEHFDPNWQFLSDYNKDNPENLFRPYGSTIGHWLEWARLLIQLNGATHGTLPWIPDAAQQLFNRAIEDGWDFEHTGFAFSTDWSGTVVNSDRYHWVITEAIGAAVALYRLTAREQYLDWYRKFWDHAEAFLIERADRSWKHQLDGQNVARSDAWDGKPDLYHALQATLFARVPTEGSLILNIADGRIDGADRA